MLFVENHLTYSKDEAYNQILRGIRLYEKSTVSQIFEQNDVILIQKMFFYAQEGKQFPIFDAPYQEALKTRSQKDLVLQMLAGQSSHGPGRGKQASAVPESKARACMVKVWEGLYLKINSRSRKFLDFVQFANLLYIALCTPIVVAFQMEMRPGIVLLESISLLLSIGWIIGNFRTQVLIKGVPTLKIQTLFKHYMLNGFVLDICGAIPFHLVLGSISFKDQNGAFIIFITLLRLVRVLSSWRAVQLFGKAEIIFRNNYLQVCKALLAVFFLGHFLTCQWYWFVAHLEQHLEPEETWLGKQKLHLEGKDGKEIWEKYLRCIYLVYNIVCSVGYGDMYPSTDAERAFFTYLMSFGDLMFALAFGLITRVTLQLSLTNETRLFKEKMHNIQEFMSTCKLDQAQQRRVEQYFAYEYQQKYNSNLLMYVDLVKYLPYGLREEVMYQSFKELLTSMFQEYKSENLIRQLACVLESQIFLPGDYIIYKGDSGDEMYFIAEGSVFVLSEDKQNVTNKLGKGGYFGEIAILVECRRQDFVQAETFCIIIILKKENFDVIKKNFPEIETKLRLKAAERIEEMKLSRESSESSFEDNIQRKQLDILEKLDDLSAGESRKVGHSEREQARPDSRYL
jgi:CRP-like cAMP-binding protein